METDKIFFPQENTNSKLKKLFPYNMKRVTILLFGLVQLLFGDVKSWSVTNENCWDNSNNLASTK